MLEEINRFLGAVTPIVVVLAGGSFAVMLRGLPFSRPHLFLRALRGGGVGGTSPVKSLLLALAGTLGVGNIVGVSSAIALGGAGAVFWMWISAVFAMFLKYAEVVLALAFRKTLADGSHRGGAPYYIRAILGKRTSPRRAGLEASGFAVLCLINAILMGCVIQSNAAARAMEASFSVPPLLCGLLVSLLCLLLTARGKRVITAVTSILVPVMSGVFLLLSLAVLIGHREHILPTLARIVTSALSPSAMGGGIVGFLTSRALRFGTVRGIISNEAGCGTSPTAHAASNAKSPVEQGLFGIIEVAVDTLLLCTVTALSVMIGWDGTLADDPMRMTVRAYTSALGGAPWVGKLLSVSILCFAFATLLCWCHYGSESLIFLAENRKSTLTAERASRIFSVVFCVSAAVGALTAPALVWSLTDLITGTMTLFNTAILLVGRRHVRRATEDYFGISP